MVDPVAHVAKCRAKSCETDDRQAHPLRESQTDGVAAEMVTELMGENPSELFVCQIAGGIRRNDEEVAATGEGVEIVGVDNCEYESLARNSMCIGNDVPCFAESHEFVCVGSARTEHPGEDCTLDWSEEEPRSTQECKDCKEDERDPRRLVDGHPDDGNGDQPHWEERRNWCERRECREINFSALCGHTFIQPALS